jgi:hypothetical protein
MNFEKKDETAAYLAENLGIAKLASSGLTKADAEILGIQILTPDETLSLGEFYGSKPALKLNYYDISGNPLPDHPTAPPYFRLRYLNQSEAKDGVKQLRYIQPAKTLPVAYYPRNAHWPTVATDVKRPIIITEGELKAAKACKEGFPTIGLGGVYSFKCKEHGFDWLPSLESVLWLRRYVYICFDSDYKTNPMICKALQELSEALQARGAFVHIVTLPQLHGMGKVGLDDFLTAAGREADNALRSALTEASPLGCTRKLFEMNSKYCYVRKLNAVVDLTTFERYQLNTFKDGVAATMTVTDRQVTKDGNVVLKQQPAAPTWLKWAWRNSVDLLGYIPSGELYVERDGTTILNTWRGFGVRPCSGSVDPFLKLVDHLFTNSTFAAKEWFLNWCACPFQNVGVKMFSAVVLQGLAHGTGKTLVGVTLGKIYGQNFSAISQDQLHSQFNEWLECKQFILADEITGSDKRRDADKLKNLITNTTVGINRKFSNLYTIDDCANYFFTTNHTDAFFLEDSDRRFFIHDVDVTPLTPEFYDSYMAWLDDGGAGKLLNWFLKRDLSGFNPKAPAFRTPAKDRLIVNLRSDLGSWVRDFIADADQVLRESGAPADLDLFTTKQLLQIYDPYSKTGVTANGMGRALSNAGVKQAVGGNPIRVGGVVAARYYIVKNPNLWVRAKENECAEHIAANKFTLILNSKF